MIERYVFVKLSPAYAADPQRHDIARHTRQTLARVPGVRSVSVGLPADEGSRRSWDMSIALGFENLADVEAYRQHEIHRRYVDEYLKPRMEVLKAWNFLVP